MSATSLWIANTSLISRSYVSAFALHSRHEGSSLFAETIRAATESPTLDATLPEVVMYEWRNGAPRLVGVEYVVLADDGTAGNATPPVLGGQLFHYTGAPNRYGIPAFYSLHVWAWRHNSAGLFADWNPRVSCAGYTGT